LNSDSKDRKKNWAKVYRSSPKAKEYHCCPEGESSKELIVASARGTLLRSEGIVVGDRVCLEREGDEGEWVIVEVAPRSSEIHRIIVREAKRKVTAANCDLIFILTSVSKPTFKRGIIDRFLVRAIQWDIHPIVIFNKMDQYDPKSGVDLLFERDRLTSLGVECFEISAIEPSLAPQVLSQGIEELKGYIQGKSALLLGQSGVGKSRTIMALSEGRVNLKSRRVTKEGKGKHSTTWSEVVDCDHFSLVDSPGIRSLSMDDIDPDELIGYFPDVEEVAVTCQFKDCQHRPSDRGCAFYDNPVPEVDDKLISRLVSYQRIYEECSQTPFWQRNKRK
jgi:ribosome biogenesis GTPase / thiamine phosphate phosphatase